MSRRVRSAGAAGAIACGVLLVLALVGLGSLAPGKASARAVHFDGKRVEAPQGWPVYRLSQHPRMCVRLDRRAVYLGTPGANQRCPADLMGKRRAILVEPRVEARARASALPVPARPGAKASAGGSIFTGLGFDACAAPSSRAMSAWDSSPYRAVGVYIGGVNRACSQPNLTASWVNAQTSDGWHIIPTYVGLQAPSSSCSSCAKLTPSRATIQGEEAAVDAVAQAAAIAMGPGSPIYYDMESYTRTASATGATLAFLEAWTEKLHSVGYVSGVYSSSASGIADLVAELGTGYNQPDSLWFANWNGQASSADSYIPSYAWSDHQRIHQYRGGHDETYGGTTINIDNNYVDGDTVGDAAPIPGNEDPVGSLDLVGSPVPGQVRVKGWAFDLNAPTEALAIRAYVGGRAGAPAAVPYDLGAVANQDRPDVGAKFRRAGSAHGFDVTFPIVKSGPQPVCVYALNTGGGTDRLLGCKSTSVAVAVTASLVKASSRMVKVWLACEWPEGTECPGQLALRTRIKITVKAARRGAPARTRAVTRSLGRRPFKLTGKRGHGFVVPLTAGARKLLKERGSLNAQLITAIPGGRRVLPIRIGP